MTIVELYKIMDDDQEVRIFTSKLKYESGDYYAIYTVGGIPIQHMNALIDRIYPAVMGEGVTKDLYIDVVVYPSTW